MNGLLLRFAEWLDAQSWSTGLHESFYLYNWIEATHVLTLMLFLGMLFTIDVRLLGLGFNNIPASRLAAALDRPMLLGFAVMVVSGLLLFYAIPVRSTQSIWLRLKLVMLVVAGVNALLFRNYLRRAAGSWDHDPLPPLRARLAGGLSLFFWSAVVVFGRLIAYDWYDCHRDLPRFLYQVAGCVNELVALDAPD